MISSKSYSPGPSDYCPVGYRLKLQVIGKETLEEAMEFCRSAFGAKQMEGATAKRGIFRLFQRHGNTDCRFEPDGGWMVFVKSGMDK
jgi:hypothetical protein